LATSRINFRLLAREAQSRGRRLSIVAGDGATRALAASAGLAVFGSVAEFESALADSGDILPSGVSGSTPTVAAPAVAAPAVTPLPAPAPPVPAKRSSARSAKADRARPDAEATTLFPAAEVAAPVAAPVAAAAAAPVAPVAPPPVSRPVTTPLEMPRPSQPPPSARRAGAGAGGFGISSARSRGRMVGALVGAVIVLALVVGGVAAYLLLPSATITVTPRSELLGPVSLTIRADPSMVTPDAAGSAVPAQRISFDLAASDTFPVKGKRIAETKATGRVTFRSKDPTTVNRISAGSIVSTSAGVRFRTTATALIPKATFVGLTVIPGQASVGVEAVVPGTAGNVDANAITVIPANEDPILTDVRNRAPTIGGTHTETPRIDQADIDAATAQLTAKLGEQFQMLLADPGRSPAGSTLFAQTATSADPAFSVDPTRLIGQEVASFDLGATSTGSATAVDRSAVTALAAEVLQGRVAAGHRLVDGSVDVRTDTPIASGEIVMFPVTARAQQVQVLDAKALAAKIKGRPIFQARSLLEPYGDVQIGVWPDWVTSIPTIDGRIDLRVGPSGSPSPSPLPGSSPSTAP
jgi:hypothetical protein